jgi:hypothetical protein
MHDPAVDEGSISGVEPVAGLPFQFTSSNQSFA